MDRLFVFYDGTCEFCCRCANWLRGQKSYLPIECMPLHCATAQRMLGYAEGDPPPGEMTVLDSLGNRYTGDSAYIMCLWALKKHRRLAHRIASPVMRPVARRFFAGVSRARKRIPHRPRGAPPPSAET